MCVSVAGYIHARTDAKRGQEKALSSSVELLYRQLSFPVLVLRTELRFPVSSKLLSHFSAPIAAIFKREREVRKLIAFLGALRSHVQSKAAWNSAFEHSAEVSGETTCPHQCAPGSAITPAQAHCYPRPRQAGCH